MEKTERALMISLDTLIDTFNFNAEIKTTELANWKRDTAALSTVWIFFFLPAKPFRELSFPVSSNKQEPHFYVHSVGRQVALLDEVSWVDSEAILTY